MADPPSRFDTRVVMNPVFAIVVDDDPSVCKALARLLRIAGMEVETFESAERFLRAPLRREPDCLVLDIRMPAMSGPDLRDRLHAAGRRIPVVFITAHADDEDGAPGGTAKVLRKPFDGQVLLDAIHLAAHKGTA